jgi:tripartite-type tricarboxylate transporter receptor subunit TctC
MDMKKTRLVMVLLLLRAVTVHAQTLFFQGKTIRIVTGYPAGDVNDTWPRLIGQYMTKYIPGNPTIIVQNMPGAGAMIAANHVYGVAKPDWLTLGWIAPGLFGGARLVDLKEGESLSKQVLDTLTMRARIPRRVFLAR